MYFYNWTRYLKNYPSSTRAGRCAFMCKPGFTMLQQPHGEILDFLVSNFSAWFVAFCQCTDPIFFVWTYVGLCSVKINLFHSSQHNTLTVLNTFLHVLIGILAVSRNHKLVYREPPTSMYMLYIYMYAHVHECIYAYTLTGRVQDTCRGPCISCQLVCMVNTPCVRTLDNFKGYSNWTEMKPLKVLMPWCMYITG